MTVSGLLILQITLLGMNVYSQCWIHAFLWMLNDWFEIVCRWIFSTTDRMFWSAVLLLCLLKDCSKTADLSKLINDCELPKERRFNNWRIIGPRVGLWSANQRKSERPWWQDRWWRKLFLQGEVFRRLPTWWSLLRVDRRDPLNFMASKVVTNARDLILFFFGPIVSQFLSAVAWISEIKRSEVPRVRWPEENNERLQKRTING